MESSSEVLKDDGDKRSPFDDLNREELIKKCKGLLVIAQKSKQAKTDLQNEIESYKLKLEECASEKNADKKSIHTLQELVDSLTEQKLNYITEIDLAENKIKSLTVACKNYEEEINKHKADVIVKNTNISEMFNKLSNLDNEVISLKRQNSRLEEENEQLINELSKVETGTMELIEIGLQQREKLRLLAEQENSGCSSDNNSYELTINELNHKVSSLEADLKSSHNCNEVIKTQLCEHEAQLKYMTSLYETEKDKKDKVNLKLKSYKDKILKCAACINQLKNTRYILTKTVKEYSDSIPKWQNDIIKASKILDEQISGLTNEIKSLRERLNTMEQEYKTIFDRNSELTQDKKQLAIENSELISSLQNMQSENEKLNGTTSEFLQLQIKALESEKSILVKEKFNAKDNSLELEKQIDVLSQQLNVIKTQNDSLKMELDSVLQERKTSDKNKENNTEINLLKNEIKSLQEHCHVINKENENLVDLNGMLKDEVETLKLSLEQPKDETENLSDINVSLQADIVKLETKLAAYKQENLSLLIEVKENRNKLSELQTLVAEHDDVKAKLSSYKSENTELLHEMKEINQELKERGEYISKMEKAIKELERLYEALAEEKNTINCEKEDLLKKYTQIENEFKNAQKLHNEQLQKTEQVVIKYDETIKEISEKDATIFTLREEIEKLKHLQSANMDLPNEDMSTSTISKAEEHYRMKDLDDSFEEKYTKLRVFALKLKKKLNETTNELLNVQNDKIKLEKMLSENNVTVVNDKPIEDVNKVNHIDSVICPVDTEFTQKEVSELQNKIKNLTSKIQADSDLKTELENLKMELILKESQLSSEIDSHKITKETLEKVKRDVKKKSVLSLEMEDYERSMKELTNKMEEKQKKMIQMESTIDMQQGTLNTMKTQIKLLEDQIKIEENQNRSIKEELQQATDEVNEKESAIAAKNEVINKLEQGLEEQKRKYEDLNVEMTALLGEKEKTIISLCEDKLELNNKVKKLEFKCAELEEKMKNINIELEDLKTDYTSYKVRAQAVLRQNQTIDHSHEEQLKEETAALKVQNETLKLKLTAIEGQCEELKLSAESERRKAVEASAELARAGQRTARLQADVARLASHLESERTHHKLQVSTLTQCYKSQISELEAKLAQDTEELKRQVAAARREAEGGSARGAGAGAGTAARGGEEGSDGEMDLNVTMLPREEGEGSESAPSPPLSKQYSVSGGGGRSPVPLERLLEEGVPEDEALEAASLALTPEQEIVDLRRKLQDQIQRVKHVTVLLAESERECARAAQQGELLKAEVRRARGSLERTQHAHNAEYMKNVTLKFVTLPAGDERERLVPVLQKILTLSPEETQKLTAVAKGMDPNPTRGWGSYLPWPGAK